MTRSRGARRSSWFVAFLLFVGSTCLLSGQTGTPQAQLLRGNELLEYGRYYEAIQEYQAAVRQNPNFAAASYGLAQAYFYITQYDEALLHVQQALRSDPRNLEYQNFRGRVLLALGRVAEARQVFDGILAAAPLNREALLGKAELLISVGELSQAQTTFLSTLSLHPRDRRALLSLAILYQELKDYQMAERYIEQALDYYSENSTVQTLAAEIQLGKGNLAAAERHLSMALSNPEQVHEAALQLRTKLLLEQRRYEEVLTVLDRLMSLYPESDMLWYTRALAQHNLGKPADAIASLRRALRYNPQNEVARLFLEHVAVLGTDFSDPLRTELAAYRLGQAREYMLQFRYGHALNYLDRGLMVAPSSEAVRRARVEVFQKTQSAARSVEELDILLGDMGVQDRTLSDLRETLRHSLISSVSRQSGIDQFEVPLSTTGISLYAINGPTAHPDAARFVAMAVGEALLGSPRISLTSDPLRLGRYQDPVPVQSASAAFADARQKNTEYYLVLTLGEASDAVSIRAELFLTRTGRPVYTYQSTRTGNNRIMESVVRLVDKVLERIPVKGRILSRNLTSGIINLGREILPDTVTKLVILPANELLLDPSGLSYQVSPQRILGTFEITGRDERISTGTITRAGSFDSVNVGDAVVVQSAANQPESDKDSSGYFPYLYNRIRGIR